LGKELAGEVADRQAVVRVLVEQALVCGDAQELLGAALGDDVLAWVVEEDVQGELSPPWLADAFGQLRGDDALVDADEEVGEIELEVVAGAAPVLRLAADLGFQPPGGVERATAGDAGAGIGDEAGLEARADLAVEQVVHDAVAELGGPYFAHLGPGDDKADRGAGPIGAGLQLVVQRGEVVFELLFEGQRAGAVAFGAAAVEVGFDQVAERKLGRVAGIICGRPWRGSGC